MDSLLSIPSLQWAAVALALIVFLWPKKRSQLPPGPRGLPLIGHLHLLGSLPHLSLQKLSQRYGSLVFLRFGGVPVLVVSSREMAREVLQTHDAAFASRPFKVAGEYLFYKSRDIAFSPNNQYWKNTRKLCATELFTTRGLSSFTGIIKDEVFELCSELLKPHHSPVNVRSCLSAFSFNVVTRLLMRKPYFGPKATTEHPEEAAEFVALMQDISTTVGSFCIGDAFPRLSNWLMPEAWLWKGIRRRINAFLDRVLLEHREMMNKQGGEDFMDVMIAHFGWNAVEDIKAITLDLLSGGTETSAATIEWALAGLLHKPELFEKAQVELNRVVGPNRMVEEDDIPHLEFMNAVIRETFRMYCPVPLLFPHACERPVKVGGYDIPERTTLLVNYYAIGRDEKVWEDAEEFRPERFVGSDVDVYGLDFELLPFGAGRRRCPGVLLAMKVVTLGLCNLVHGFEWSFPEGVTPGMAGSSGVVNVLEKPLHAHAAPKLAPNIYESLKL